MRPSDFKVAALESVELALSRLKLLRNLQFSTKSATLWRFLRASELIDYRASGLKRLCSEDTQLFTNSTITSVLRKHAIDAIYLGGHSSLKLEAWAKRERFKLISLPHKQQALLENKIYFDGLLKKHKIASPHSLILRSDKQLNSWMCFPAVLQVPQSHGSLGTFIVSSADHIHKVIRQRRLKYPLLLREFVAGIPCGVTIVLSKRRMLVSALRAQCSLTDRGSENFYFGIQWIPASLFSASALARLNRCIEDLANLMRALEVRGAVHFDLMVSNTAALVIECNPRPSGACPQLALCPKLLHGLDFPNEHTRSLLGAELSADRASIPRSTIEGCTIDFDFMLPELRPGHRKYSGRQAGWIADRSSGAGQGFLYPYHPKGSSIASDDTLGVYVSSRPFFKVTTARIDFRADSERQLRALARYFI